MKTQSSRKPSDIQKQKQTEYVQAQQSSEKYDPEYQQTLQSFQVMTNNSFNNRASMPSDQVSKSQSKSRVNAMTAPFFGIVQQPTLTLSENFAEMISEIQSSVKKVKEGSDDHQEILKQMNAQGEKLGSAISFLRQFMFMNNINFDNSKFLQDQQNYNNNSSDLNKSQSLQKPPSKKQLLTPTYFNAKSKSPSQGNELNQNKRDKSPLSSSQQSQQQQQLSLNQSQQAPSKLSGMLSSILQERKQKGPAVNKSTTSLKKNS